MKKIKTLYFGLRMLIYAPPCFATEAPKPMNIFIVDTHFSDPYYFNTLTTILKHLNFNTQIKSWYNTTTSDLQRTDLIYIEPSLAQLAATLKPDVKNPILAALGSKLALVLDNILKHKKPLIIGIQQTPRLSQALPIYKALLQTLGVTDNSQLELLLQHLILVSAHKSFNYDTALLTKRSNSATKKLKKIAQELPRENSLPPELQPLYPFGSIFSKDPLIILLSADYLHAFDMQEDFMLNPMDTNLRHNFTQHLIYTWHDIKNLLQKSSKKDDFPIKLSNSYSAEQQQKAHKQRAQSMHNQYQWIDNEKIACAWMNLNPFKAASSEEQLAQAKRILQSKVNLIWLELMPEMYLGKRSVATQKTKDAWLNTIAQFTQALKDASKKTGFPIPKILVGMELTWNFANNAPENPARDIYGTVYPHIPNPLDIKQFWEAEVIDVFKQFYELWKTKIGNNIPLAGAFLDLEMYHAPKETGQFLNTMDFSEKSWKKATNTIKNLATENQDHHTRILSLLKKKLIETYFAFLEQQAEYIGKHVAQGIRSILPNALIGVYNITLPYNWFYKGFLKGLSSPKHPIILATFNLEAYRHYPWLIQNNIHAFHIPPLLLSKFRSINDFSLIKKLGCQHDGIWFNRFSQLEEKIKDYQNVEVTKLPTDIVIHELSKQLPLKSCR